MTHVDPPTDLQADDAIRQVRAHGGLLLHAPADTLTAYIHHLRTELAGVLEVNDWQHQELTERDHQEATTTTTTEAH